MTNTIDYNEEARKVAYAHNLCVVIASQIYVCDDKYYLQQVYSEILNNLNLENFPKDSALLEALKRLLDTLAQMNELLDQKEAIEQRYQRQKKNAFWSAIPSPAILLSGGNPASIAANALISVGTAFMNYKKQLACVDESKIDSTLKIEEQRKEAIHACLVGLFNSAWELTKDYSIPDELRLSEKDVQRYNGVIADTDLLRRYERLKDMRTRFAAYPPFWYNFGETAREIYNSNQKEEYRQKAISAYEEFDRIHFDYLREDIFAASCVISHCSLLDAETDTERIKNLLNKAIQYSRDNFDLIQQCVPIALRIRDIDTARMLLERLTNEDQSLDINGRLLSMIYNRYYFDKEKYETLVKRIGKENTVGWISIRPEFRLDRFDDNMCNSDFALDFSGRE